MLGQDRLEKNLAKFQVEAARFRVDRQTLIDKTNDFVMKSEQGALVGGSDPPSGHSVHHTVGDMWQTPARRLIQNIWPLVCRKQPTKNLDPSPMAKNRHFFMFERRA